MQQQMQHMMSQVSFFGWTEKPGVFAFWRLVGLTTFGIRIFTEEILPLHSPPENVKESYTSKYLLRFGILGIFGGSSHTFSGGGPRMPRATHSFLKT